MSMTIHPQSGTPPLTGNRVSYSDFLIGADAGEHVEWVDGKVVEMSPVSQEHSDVGLFLLRLISAFVEAGRLGKVFYGPFQMKSGPELPGRSPDILFVARQNLVRLKRLHLEGPADLVIEIVSERCRQLDSVEKLREYEKGGVPEYWVVDPARSEALFYHLEFKGRYRPTAIEPDGVFRSRALPGMWIQTGWLWQKPLPAVMDVLRTWRLV
jgi:Uma2 family endonuclease